MANKYPPAYRHGEITKLVDDVFWVHGSVKMAPLMTMNRNMIIVREKGELFLINPIRLNLEEERRLNELGTVKAIMRLGDFHGLDDQYYIDTYHCQFWAQPGQTTYPEPNATHEISQNVQPPIDNAMFFIFTKAIYPEAGLLLKDKTLFITTDSIQYWTDWQHMSLLGKLLLWLMGFRLGLFIGKPWIKRVTPKGDSLASDFNRLMDLDFDHLIAAHGKPLMNTAKEDVMKMISKEFGKA